MKSYASVSVFVSLCAFVIISNAPVPTAQAQTEAPPARNGDTLYIANLDNLAWLQDPNNDSVWANQNDYFKQTANINADSTLSWNSGTGFLPIGSSVNFPFKGVYDGGGYSITGLYESESATSACGGMFGVTDGATLKNIALDSENITETGTFTYAGGLVGEDKSSNIDNCTVSGAVTANVGEGVGGLVGYTLTSVGNLTISNSSSTADITGGLYTGGLIGESSNTNLNNCHSSGAVTSGTSNADVGGLVGSNLYAINACFSTGSVSATASNSNAGGLVGSNGPGSTVNDCYSSSDVSATSTGGEAGLIAVNQGSANNCYSAGGSVQGVSGGYAGGLVSSNYVGSVDYCFSADTVSGASANGGLIAINTGGSVGNSFWDTGSSGQSGSPGGGQPESDSAMKAEATFTGHGWDFTNTWGIYSAINGGYPYLQNVTQFSAPAASAPTAVTSPVSSIAGTSAIVNGAASSDGATTVVYFLYGTSSGNYPDSVTASQSPLIPWDSIEVSDTLKGLTGSTTYYVRVSSKNSVGYARGSEISFTTLAPPTPPTAVTDSVSAVGGTTATAYGSSNPDGASDTVRFLYGTVSGTYTDSVTAAQSPATGYSPVNVSANLSGLAPLQTYYWLVSASNGLGYVRGTEKSFTTTSLVVEAAPSGSGTSGDPHIISSLDNLAWLQDANNDTAWGDYYKQSANINAALTSTLNSGAGLSPIGTGTSFSGTYDGQGYLIDSLYISRTGSNNQGLFGTTSSSAVIDSLGLTNANVSGYDFVGALVGLNSSGASVSHCYSSGKVYATRGDCGGLIGENDGAVATSFSKCNVAGGNNFSLGGLVGYSPSGTISNCYSTGEVNVGCGGAGGLLGNNSGGTVSNCYSVSRVAAPNTYGGLIGGQYSGSVGGSFWDTDSTSSGAGSGSIGAAGKTTSQMQMESTFTDSSWDFTSTWAINGSVNGGFPYLAGVDHSLAVQATDFVATAEVGSVTLTWKTESEVNNAGFNVLKEQLGVGDWQLVGSYTGDDSLRGLGTSSSGRTYDFTDDKVISGDAYTYKIQSVSTNGTVKDLSTLSVTVDVPKIYALYQNYPNPFNPTTVISYQLPAASQVTLKVYDILGREVATLVNGQQNAGVYKVDFNGSQYASGVYFYRIDAIRNDGQKFVSIKKAILLK